MMARTALLFLLASTGCVTTGGGSGPTDAKMFMVREAIGEVALKSFEKHCRGDDWTMRSCVFGSGSGGGGATRWYTDFVCLPTGEDYHTSQKLFALPEADLARILVPIRSDVLAAVEKSGVTVTSATAVETLPGTATARFTISYLRKNGKVAGEVIGSLAPSETHTRQDTLRWTHLSVKQHEWRVEE